MSHLLVTAFEPFGLLRGHVPGLRGNRSRTLLEALQATLPTGTAVRFELLPVDPACHEALARRLAEGPAGVLLMGEDLLSTLRVETRARDPRMQLGPIPLPGAAWRTSAFATSLAAHLRGRGVSTRSDIGTYYCNRVYWQALEWAAGAGDRPVAFLHVGPLASAHWQLAQVRDALALMQTPG